MTAGIAKSSLVLGLLGLVAAPAGGCFSSNNSSPPDAGITPDSSLPESAAPELEGSVEAALDAGPSDAPSGPCYGSSSWYQGDGGTCFISLAGNWTPSVDANSNGPDTIAMLSSATESAVSIVESHGEAGPADCGCNGQHLQIPLGHTFSCASSTLEFVYSTTAHYDAGNLDTPTVNIRFCTGPCQSDDAGGPNFYSGPQYVGSPAAPGTSSCAYEWENDAGTASLNYFPASANIGNGQKTTVPLGSYMAPSTSDMCTGTFDTIDVHMQVYNCFTSATGTSTLSGLRIY